MLILLDTEKSELWKLVDYRIPKEGDFYLYSDMVLLADSDHPENALHAHILEKIILWGMESQSESQSKSAVVGFIRVWTKPPD